MAAREVMDSIGVGQKYCNEIIAKVHKIGNNLGLPEPALAEKATVGADEYPVPPLVINTSTTELPPGK